MIIRRRQASIEIADVALYGLYTHKHTHAHDTTKWIIKNKQYPKHFKIIAFRFMLMYILHLFV